MATAKCTKQYFQNVNDITHPLNWMLLAPVASYDFTAARPFIPLAILDPNNNYQVDFVNSKNFPLLSKDIMEDCLTASYNYTNDIVAPPTYSNGDYASYLAQRIGVKTTIERYQRFKITYNTIVSFWQNFVSSGDYVTDLSNLQKLIDFLKINSDKRYWIAPGTYRVENPNPTSVLADAILLANPLWVDGVPVLILEIESIG
jgi:hypothetical protein